MAERIGRRDLPGGISGAAQKKGFTKILKRDHIDSHSAPARLPDRLSMISTSPDEARVCLGMKNTIFQRGRIRGASS